jgi:hypothetical protein
VNLELNAAIWGAITGALMSLLITLALPLLRRCIITWRVSISADVPHNGFARFRVANNSFWTINDAALYISLDFDKTDTLLCPFTANTTQIDPSRFVPLKDDQLCWSVQSPVPNPIRVTIFAKERQPFALCQIMPTCIEIPSEKGWVNARVFLRRGKIYKGVLKIVSADTSARYFRIVIDPDSGGNPCTIESVCRFDIQADI